MTAVWKLFVHFHCRCPSLASVVSLHTDTSKSTKATLRVVTRGIIMWDYFIDTSKNTKAWFRCCYVPHSSIDTNQQNTKVSCVEELCGDYFTDTTKNTKAWFRCCYVSHTSINTNQQKHKIFMRWIVMWGLLHWYQQKHKSFIQMLLCVA